MTAQRPRVLIVEDEFLLALFLEETLQDLGCDVVGVVSGAGPAQKAVTEQAPDGVLLDVNLGGSTAFEIADLLKSRQIPFAFATGYSLDESIRRQYGVPCLQKPLLSHHLAEQFLPILSRRPQPQ